jgi:hypothetical protein
VIIGVQNHGDFLQTADEQLALVKAVNSEWCGPDRRYRLLQDPRPLRRHRQGRPHGGQLADQGKPLRRPERPAHGPGPPPPDRPQVRLSRVPAHRNPFSAGKTVRPFHVVPAFHKQLREAIAQTAVS